MDALAQPVLEFAVGNGESLCRRRRFGHRPRVGHTVDLDDDCPQHVGASDDPVDGGDEAIGVDRLRERGEVPHIRQGRVGIEALRGPDELLRRGQRPAGMQPDWRRHGRAEGTEVRSTYAAIAATDWKFSSVTSPGGTT